MSTDLKSEWLFPGSIAVFIHECGNKSGKIHVEFDVFSRQIVATCPRLTAPHPWIRQRVDMLVPACDVRVLISEVLRQIDIRVSGSFGHEVSNRLVELDDGSRFLRGDDAGGTQNDEETNGDRHDAGAPVR